MVITKQDGRQTLTTRWSELTAVALPAADTATGLDADDFGSKVPLACRGDTGGEDDRMFPMKGLSG